MEFKKLLAFPVLLGIFFWGVHSSLAESFPFSDVSTDHWAYDDIQNLYDLGIISGKSANTYDPNSSVTVAEFVKISMETASVNAEEWLENDFFTDGGWGALQYISENDWFYSYINAAYLIDLFDKTEPDIDDQNYEPDYTNYLYRYPNTPISRVNATNILMNSVNLDECMSAPEENALIDIEDWSSPGNENYEKWLSINTAAYYGIITGFDEDGHPFKPSDQLTRTEAAAIASRAYEAFFMEGAQHAELVNLDFSPNHESASPGCQR